jgi:GrpB-like predicted nucleotidyltransferase (UPF0157 family)
VNGADARSGDELRRDPSLDERHDPAVRLIPHDPAWPLQARRELRLIADALGPIAVGLEHVGSTAVPGLAAKPILDLQVSVASLQARAQYLEPLRRLGYKFIADPDSPDYLLFAKPALRPRSHHLHVCSAGSAHEARHIAVREYLRATPAEARRYEALKRSLVERAPADRLAYIAGKREYVDALERRALRWPGA